jgi:hypothetical protein
MRLVSTTMAYVKKQVLRPTFLGCEIIAFTLRDQQPKGTAAHPIAVRHNLLLGIACKKLWRDAFSNVTDESG